ncbi:MAG: hypothetical protein M3081_12245 [Gemmatimonadota bacterium]|nr:hypothetical protein [Gemmatimonadota bacterium]
MPKKLWKKGRGKLGFLQPLLGDWEALGESPIGPVRCTRRFDSVLGDSYIQLSARWQFGKKAEESGWAGDGGYREHAIFGAGPGGTVRFWSFTSDGKRSEGVLANVTDLHPEAIGFEAQMPAGLARQAYWPIDDGSVKWVVESRNKKGWKRFVEHTYRSRG